MTGPLPEQLIVNVAPSQLSVRATATEPTTDPRRAQASKAGIPIVRRLRANALMSIVMPSTSPG